MNCQIHDIGLLKRIEAAAFGIGDTVSEIPAEPER